MDRTAVRGSGTRSWSYRPLRLCHTGGTKRSGGLMRTRTGAARRWASWQSMTRTLTSAFFAAGGAAAGGMGVAAPVGMALPSALPDPAQDRGTPPPPVRVADAPPLDPMAAPAGPVPGPAVAPAAQQPVDPGASPWPPPVDPNAPPPSP